MNIQLPHKLDGDGVMLEGVRQITIIGANGSGKTRFCNELMTMCGDKAYRLCALRAIFPEMNKNELKGSIDDLWERLNDMNPHVKSEANTEFDRLVYLMLSEEFRELMNYKTHQLMQDDSVCFPKTKLDITVRMWQEVFPKNKVLRENGKLLFKTEGQADRYSPMRLSDGEKAVLYYIGAVLYAMPDAVILVDDPETFIHQSLMTRLWNVIEEMRPDCTFIYNTHDLNFVSSRIDNHCVWVKSYDPAASTWDYEVMNRSNQLSDALYLDILGARKPVLFIEGDETHSIDAKLYPLIFPEYTVKPLGSCNKVIESVRSFNDLQTFHHMDSWGIVDRDRRTAQEVQYLREKKIFVPNVAEIENIMMLEGVIRAVARHRHRNEDEVFTRVRKNVLHLFECQLKQQALQHVRHHVKHDVEIRIDKRFTNISALEEHMVDLVTEINPRGIYEDHCRRFHNYLKEGNYEMVLQVFNQKMMLIDSNVAGLLGLENKDEYIKTVLNILKSGSRDADAIRTTIKQCFGFSDAKEEELAEKN